MVMKKARTAEITIATSEMSDEEVVGRVRCGETALFEVLMRRHNQRLYRAARSILGDDSEAEDVMQDAYVRSFQHLDQFDGRARFSTWLTRIAVNEALARLRKRQRLTGLEAWAGSSEGGGSPESGAPSPEQELLTHAMRLVLEASADRLPEAYRSVFVMRDVEGMNTAETAEFLGLSEDGVRVRLHRARALMREHIYSQTGMATMGHF